MLTNVFVYKMWCELSCPKSTQNVSGILRNARLVLPSVTRGYLGCIYVTSVEVSWSFMSSSRFPLVAPVFVYMMPVQNLTLEGVVPVGAHPGSCTGLPLLILVRNSYEIHVNVVRPFFHIPFRFQPVDSRVKLARTFMCWTIFILIFYCLIFRF